jgi:hypothetical protein
MGLLKDRIQRREDPLPMKSVIEILGQILFGISFDIQDSFEEYLSEQHRAFLAMLKWTRYATQLTRRSLQLSTLRALPWHHLCSGRVDETQSG